MANWSTLYLAGSGASYQWDSARGNGDLDILLGFDYVEFMDSNEQFRGLSDDDLADYMNTELKTGLWPETSNTDFNGQTYEVTYFQNAGTGTDITNIHPYAAYNLSDNVWVVPPPNLPQDPKTLYPREWFDVAGAYKTKAEDLTRMYNHSLHELHTYHPHSPGWITANSRIALVAQQGKDLFDELHLGRKDAFKEGGHGYGDWTNFRWQVAKGSGAVEMLHQLATIDAEAHTAQSLAQYGENIDPASVALRKAAQWANGYGR